MSIPVLDLHCDTADRLGWQTIDRELKTVSGDEFFTPDDAECPERYFSLKDNDCAISIDMAEGTPWAQCFATFVPDCFSPEQSLRFHAQIMAHISAQTNLNHAEATEVHAASDIRPALDQGRFACIHTIENARMFAHDLNLIEALKRAGVLMASLTWNAAGPLASGHDTHAGLTDLGRQAIAEMERCGMVLDVSHLNDECFDEVAALAKRPFVASHSNSRAVCGHVRNLTDQQFQVIRDGGGVVGLDAVVHAEQRLVQRFRHALRSIFAVAGAGKPENHIRIPSQWSISCWMISAVQPVKVFSRVCSILFCHCTLMERKRFVFRVPFNARQPSSAS